MKRGDLAWIRADKDRASIIIAIDDETVSAVTGTKTKRELPHVCVYQNDRAGKILGLSCPTFFYPTSIVVVRKALVLKVPGPCPMRVFLALEALLLEP